MCSQKPYGRCALPEACCQFTDNPYSNITPPVDDEEDLEESLSIEEKARADLEHNGCPPCYPANVKFPLFDVPSDFKEIVSYWQSVVGIDGLVLKAQLDDWQKFLAARAAKRSYYEQNFLQYMRKVNEVRQEYSITGSVDLHLDSIQQNHLETWTEFQYYHLTQHTRLKMELHKQRNVGKQQSLQRKVDNHDILLHWIEKQRNTMSRARGPAKKSRQNYRVATKTTTISGQVKKTRRMPKPRAPKHPSTVTTRSGRRSLKPTRYVP
jgi:hypothetical protein